MPAQSGNNFFNVGRDIQVIALDQNGQPITLDNITGHDAKQVTANIKVDKLDSTQMNAELPKGWTVDIEGVRAGPSLDNFFANLETQWYQNGTYNTSSVYVYITEPNGSTSSFQYTNVAFKYTESGSWAGDKEVKWKIEGVANRRIAI
jgi:hypothetical protein